MKKPNYQHSILNVSTTLLNHYGVKTNYKVLNELTPHLEHKKHVMLMLLDGMGMNILENLDKKSLFRTHVKTELTSVYPPTTVAATTSVLSGLPPLCHGHVGWVQYNRFDETNTVVFLNIDADQPERLLKDNFREKHLSYPTILEQIQAKNPELKVQQLMPSFVKGGFDTFDQQIDRLIEISKGEASFSYTYWTEPDLSIHTSGTHTPLIKNLLETLNHSVERLYENISDDTLVIIIADHGLIDVEGVNLWDKKDLLDLLYRKPSIEPRSTAFFVKLDERKRFKQLFKQYFNHKFKLYTKEQFYKLQLLGKGEPHPLLDDFIGDFMAVAHKKYMFVLRPEKSFLAHHAGLHKKEMMVPLIILDKNR